MKYKTFFENSADAMLIIEDGEFMDCNPAAVAMLGYDRKDEICHVSPAGLSPEFQSDGCSSVEKSLAMIRQAKGQGSHRFEWDHLRKDGTLLQVEVSLTVIPGPSGMQLHTVWRDITDRKQAELTLRKSEESYRLLIENQTDLVVKVDLEGRFLFVSPSYCRMFGKTEEQLLGHAFMPVVHPDDQAATDQAMKALYAAPHAAYMEQRAMTKEGWRWLAWQDTAILDKNGEVVEIIGVGRDITERKQAEAAQRKSEERFKAIFDGSLVALWEEDYSNVWTLIDALKEQDMHDFSAYLENHAEFVFEAARAVKILSVNEAALAMFAAESKELLVESLEQVFTNQSYEIFRKTLVAMVEGTSVFRAETNYRTLQGEPLDTLLSIAFPADRHQSSRVIVSIVDITERKQAEAAQRKSEERLTLAMRAAAVGIWEYDLKDDSLYWDGQMFKLYGVDPASFEGNFQSWRNGVHPEDLAPIEARFKELVDHDQPFDTELRAVHEDGGIFHLRALGMVERDGDGNALRAIGANWDITGQKQAEETLKESEDRFRSIFDATNDALFIQDLETGAILDVNRKACELYGMSREEAMHYDVEAISADVPPYTAKEASEWMCKAAAGEPQLFEWRAKDTAGRLFWVEVNMRCACVGPVERLIVSIRDVTERKRAEDALADSETRFKALHNATFGGIAIHDKGIILECNLGLSEITGYPLEELMGMDGLLLIAERTRNTVLDHILSGCEKPYEVIGSRKNGEEYPLRLEARNIPYKGRKARVVEFRDITEQKQVEAEKERFMTAIDQVAEAIVITDAEGTVEYVNPAFERITGYAREEVVGQNPRILGSGEQDASFYQSMWKTLRAGETWNGRFGNRKKDGTPYTEDAVISPVKNTDGKTVNYVAIKTDITAELAREEQVRQTQKMESVGRLAGGVAHDFNNILQTITGFCGLILAEMDPQSAHRQDVAGIQTAVRHAGDLTRQLLAFSRKQPTERRVLDLDAVLSDGRKMIQQALEKEHHLELKLASALQTVKADAVQVLQVAMNLVVNARDAMPDGGEITLSTQKVLIREEDLLRQPDAHVGKWVCLSVADAGCGMDEKQLSHLFEPFYTTKRLGKGTGLGLSVVYGIVKEHGGWIHVDSEPGHGSVFKVYLPRYICMVADSPAGDKGSVDGTASQEKQILLVEDNSAVQELAMEILRNIGYVVAVAGNVREAEALFAAKDGAFDLLFSDVVLPDGNGIELADALLERKPGLPVLLFSGHSDERAQVALIKGKGFGYMHKPFNLKKLLDAVAQRIASHRNEM